MKQSMSQSIINPLPEHVNKIAELIPAQFDALSKIINIYYRITNHNILYIDNNNITGRINLGATLFEINLEEIFADKTTLCFLIDHKTVKELMNISVQEKLLILDIGKEFEIFLKRPSNKTDGGPQGPIIRLKKATSDTYLISLPNLISYNNIVHSMPLKEAKKLFRYRKKAEYIDLEIYDGLIGRAKAAGNEYYYFDLESREYFETNEPDLILRSYSFLCMSKDDVIINIKQVTNEIFYMITSYKLGIGDSMTIRMIEKVRTVK